MTFPGLCLCNPPAPFQPSFASHFFLSAPSLSVESAQNEGSSLSGVNRRCVGEAERMTSLGCNANILPSSKAPEISHNVNCAITVMADTDKSLAYVEFGQPPTQGRFLLQNHSVFLQVTFFFFIHNSVQIKVMVMS